ncbi:hypothetical protein AYO38_01345 [bacterium SCGC AG-212-C10]|nr:hypothetical protein AYO38_01345 [bacterium SCGC AG-212-C10]
MESFEGKTAVITGGGSGIGRGIARVLAKAGANVVIADINQEWADETVNEIAELGGNAIPVRTDVSKLESLQALADAAYERFGAVHILCNNAGVMAWQHADEAVHADWEFVINVNLWGVIHGVETFLPRMLAQGDECHIVNTASIAGVIPSGVSALYSTTKFAVVGLSETMSNELAGTNVSVSVLCPGAVTSRLGISTEANRPEGSTPRPATPLDRKGLGSDVSALDADSCGELVRNAIREKRLHIFTEPTLRARVQQRLEATVADFDALSSPEALA